MATWKTAAGADKREGFARCLSPDCRYADPLRVAHGWEELLAYMLEFQRQVPGGCFVTTAFMAHHDESLADWNLVDAGGNVLGTGRSYARYGQDGKLASMTGFFEVPGSPA